MREPEPVQVIDPAHDGEATSICLNAAGQLFASGGTDQQVKLWALDGGKLLATGVGHSAQIQQVCISPDDRQLISVGDDGNIFVWNIYQVGLNLES